MMKMNALLLLACTLPSVSLAFVGNSQANRPSATFSLSSTATDKNPSTSIEPQPQFLDYLKFDGNPSFDVMAKTREYLDNRGKNPETIYSDDYVLRGPVIGPLTRKDLTSTQGQLNIAEAFPDTQQIHLA
jgi:hypothetical protein